MTSAPPTATCPHCGDRLRGVKLPRETNYDEPVHWACFNDECPYYREGWEWMQQQFEVKVSYRYRVFSRDSTKATPLPVWGDDALRDRIVDDDEEDNNEGS